MESDNGLSEGTDAGHLAALQTAAAKAGALVKIIAPKIGGVTDSSGTLHTADERLGGAPSVLFDAPAILPSDDTLAASKPAQDFLSDAYAHCKFIACNEASAALFAARGLVDARDGGVCVLNDAVSVREFGSTYKALRSWPREANLTA